MTTVDGPLEENEQLACRVDETGVISLRQVKGLRIDHEASETRPDLGMRISTF